MTLYRYVPAKTRCWTASSHGSHDLAINPAATDWRQELRDLATSFRGLAPAHPTRYPRWLPGHSPALSGNGQDKAKQSSPCVCRSTSGARRRQAAAAVFLAASGS